MSIPYASTASARTAGGIEQNFANSRPIPERIAYFDTSGKMAGSYLKSPIALKPLATVEVFIADDETESRPVGPLNKKQDGVNIHVYRFL
ncbi:DUF3124 domain-containing protein [Bradyrhizobium sp. RDI18]|uniref:DUF3124 domain-containing protein n=1 Tax=Bradyrhizobium sp. RDI18 TaxID=3367400 RepID=UPI00371895B1